MAQYRMCMKRGKVGIAKKHAQYIFRDSKYKYKEDLIYKESGNLALTGENNPINFWENADLYERNNGNAYREFELNIPNEFNDKEAIQLVQNFIKKEIGENYPYSFAIHKPAYNDKHNNIHCHLMFSDRKLDKIQRNSELFFKRSNPNNPTLGGAKKDRTWKKKEKLLEIRKSWEILTNKELEKNGYSIRVSCETLEKQKLQALKDNNIIKAESLDRNSINIAGYILQKIQRKGIDSLNSIEKQKFINYNQNIKIKLEKEKEAEIRTQKSIPTEKETLNQLIRISTLDDEKLIENTLNICTKGQYLKDKKKLAQVEKIILIFPDNKEFKENEKNLNNKIKQTQEEVKSTKQFERVLFMLTKNRNSEKIYFSDIYQNKYKKSFNNETYKNNNDLKLTNKFTNLYKNYSQENIKNRLDEIKYQDNIELAKQILTKYKLEANTEKLFKLKTEEKNLSLMKNDYNSILKDNRQEYLNKVFNNQNEITQTLKTYSLFITELDNHQLAVTKLKDKLDKNSKIETKVLNSLLLEKNKSSNNKSDLEKLENHFNIIAQIENLKKSKEYYLNNPEQFGRSLYKTNIKLQILEKNILESDEIIKNINKEKGEQILKNVTIKIENLNKIIETLENKEIKLKKLAATDNKIIILDNLTNGNYKKIINKENLAEEKLINLNKELENTSIFNIFKKNKLKQEINIQNKEINILKKQHEELEKKYFNTISYKNTLEKFKIDLKNESNKIHKELSQAKKDKYIQCKVANNINRFLKEYNYQNYPTKSVEFTRGIKHLKNNLEKVLTTQNREKENNLSIKTKENDYELER